MDGSLHIRDVVEKEVGTVRAPTFPSPKPTAAGGFPQPKKRARFASTFKQRMQGHADAPTPKPTMQSMAAVPREPKTPRPPRPLNEKENIDRENRQRLQEMSPDEIEEARQELINNLDPQVLQMLLRRANLDDASAPLPGDPERPMAPAIHVDTAQEEPEASEKHKKVLFASAEDAEDDDAPKKAVPIAQAEAVNKTCSDPSHDPSHDHDNRDEHVHFPKAPGVPDLDPDDPDFLENLHKKYFPNLPADPARLAWMAPIPTADSPADRESPYYPGQESIAVSQLRFDFRGRVIPPTKSRAIPVSKGLHHHGLAPEAAGYTIEELAILARSAVPAQRCVAFQTLGRILFRLGQGEWGRAEVDDPSEDPRAQMALGIWRSISEGRVLDTLHEAAGVEEGRGHRGSRAYAIEAVWLYEKGGWKERWRGR